MDYLNTQIRRHGLQNPPQIIPLGFDEDAPFAEECHHCVAKLASRIKGYIGRPDKWQNAHIYADITGGFRPAPMMLMNILQLLRYDGMKIEKIVYSDYQTKKLHDLSVMNELNTLTAGADSFVRYGQTQGIDAYFHRNDKGAKNDNAEDADAQSEELRALLDAMDNFSAVITLCQGEAFADNMEKLQAAIRAYQEKEHPEDEQFFVQLLETIRRKYHSVADHDSATWRLDIIQWCVENDFFQQAVTLCNEWLPRYIVERGICYPLKENEDNIKTDDSHRFKAQAFIVHRQPGDGKAIFKALTNDFEKNKVKESRELLQQASQRKLPDNWENLPFVTDKLKMIIHGAYQAESLSSKWRRKKLNAAVQADTVIATQDLDVDRNADAKVVIKSQYKLLPITRKEGLSKYLMQMKNVVGTVLDPFIKIENDAELASILDIRPEPQGIEEDKQRTFDDEWKELLYEHRIKSDVSEKSMLRALNLDAKLRQIRHKMNHASAENTISIRELRSVLNAALKDMYQITEEAIANQEWA